MKTNDDNKPVEIFSGTLWEVTILKSLLENENIEVFLKDEVMGTLNPWHTSPGGTNPVKIIVPAADIDKAVQVIKEYEKNSHIERSN